MINIWTGNMGAGHWRGGARWWGGGGAMSPLFTSGSNWVGWSTEDLLNSRCRDEDQTCNEDDAVRVFGGLLCGEDEDWVLLLLHSLNHWAILHANLIISATREDFRQCCEYKYITFGSGSRNFSNYDPCHMDNWSIMKQNLKYFLNQLILLNLKNNK